ncbi:hypothetical protein [Oricola thermophila]|uniref:Uncharacterized protein n=1 Tax=Oricola thermophila TaxID=2742145 RepID=A0A6N1V978_9HYPH|nr:hypothetical protein [Oricola thermophila]QKV17524.1 hypothetical protein HTY61_03075 [Oricola thermophila]
MTAITPVSPVSETRPTHGLRTLPGETVSPPLETQGIAAGGATSVEEMLLKLQEKAFYTEAALRVQVGDMGRQPLARVDITDLALMIISGKAMSDALAARAADQPPISATPASAYRG